MKIQPPPGMRDFYPEEMRLQNWLMDTWRNVSRSHGFQEYEGPIFEFLNLYKLKSGDEIVDQLFNFKDRGEREFAIRPEMTPTLARMVAARAAGLPRPIKWFSLPRMCRAEKPQRGRLREFFQWNVDILGVDDVLADAEVIAVAVAFLRQVGLTPDDAIVKVNSRPLAGGVLAALGIPADQSQRAFQLIDRHDKLPAEEFARQWDEAYGQAVSAARFTELLKNASLEECLSLAESAAKPAIENPQSTVDPQSPIPNPQFSRGADSPTDAGAKADFAQDRKTKNENPKSLSESASPAAAFRDLWSRLQQLGVADYCRFDPGIVRGLAYYTGVVFEVHALRGNLRALAGGGRYDDLTSLLDGPKLSGIGFGMGDAPMLEALKDLNRLPALTERLDVFVIDADPSLFPTVLSVVGQLRALRPTGSVGVPPLDQGSMGLRPGREQVGGAQPADAGAASILPAQSDVTAGKAPAPPLVKTAEPTLSVDFSYKRQAIGKQFKQASDRGARFAIVVGAEFAQGQQLTIKNLATGVQQTVPLERLLASPGEFLQQGEPE